MKFNQTLRTTPVSRIFPILCTIFLACCVTSELAQGQPTDSATFHWLIHAGIHHGGIVENTDMQILEDVEPDAFTGATNMGFNAGFRVSYPGGRLSPESGLGISTSKHSFSYNDTGHLISGDRIVFLTQFQLPINFNYILQKKTGISINAGLTVNYNVFIGLQESTGLPDATYYPWSVGMDLGVFIPLKINEKRLPGIYVEFYRGTQIFEDYYNPKEDEPSGGSSSLKIGLFHTFL